MTEEQKLQQRTAALEEESFLLRQILLLFVDSDSGEMFEEWKHSKLLKRKEKSLIMRAWKECEWHVEDEDDNYWRT